MTDEQELKMRAHTAYYMRRMECLRALAVDDISSFEIEAIIEKVADLAGSNFIHKLKNGLMEEA